VLDFNPAGASATEFSIAMNRAIDRGRPPEENVRQYLGASSIGTACGRRVQFDWWCTGTHEGQTRDVFERGHLFEEMSRQALQRAGFVFAPVEKLGFSTFNGDFRGHCDGIILDGPELPGAGYPCIWEHKALGDKGFRSIDRDGIATAYPGYYAQILVYQHYLGVCENPAILTVVNSNTMARLHVQVPFDAVEAQRWRDRALDIIEATRCGELLPRLAKTPANPVCRTCSHTARCWEGAA
jgi:hypothetical protein